MRVVVSSHVSIFALLTASPAYLMIGISFPRLLVERLRSLSTIRLWANLSSLLYASSLFAMCIRNILDQASIKSLEGVSISVFYPHPVLLSLHTLLLCYLQSKPSHYCTRFHWWISHPALSSTMVMAPSRRLPSSIL